MWMKSYRFRIPTWREVWEEIKISKYGFIFVGYIILAFYYTHVQELNFYDEVYHASISKQYAATSWRWNVGLDIELEQDDKTYSIIPANVSRKEVEDCLSNGYMLYKNVDSDIVYLVKGRDTIRVVLKKPRAHWYDNY